MLGQAMSTENNEDLRETQAWLGRHGVDVGRLLKGTLEELGPGRPLPKANLVRFQRVAILNTFFNRWLAVHQDTPWKKIPKNDLGFFLSGVILAVDGRAFERTLRSRFRLAHLGDLAAAGAVPKDGNPASYEGFVAQNVESIATKFFERFDPADPRAARGALKYLVQTAVSAYRARFAQMAARQPAGLVAYLRKNPRLDVRTRLAIKVAILAETLTPEERETLTTRFGWQPKLGRKYMIKEIAERLQYKNPATLSRKIWKVKAWARKYSARNRS